MAIDDTPPVTADQLEALRREDCTAVYNVMKFAGLADPDAYSGPELRCLFPDLALPIIGFASTAEWTAGETGGANVDSLAWLDHMEAMQGPKIAVMQDVGSRPGRGGCPATGWGTPQRCRMPPATPPAAGRGTAGGRWSPRFRPTTPPPPRVRRPGRASPCGPGRMGR